MEERPKEKKRDREIESQHQQPSRSDVLEHHNTTSKLSNNIDTQTKLENNPNDDIVEERKRENLNDKMMAEGKRKDFE